MAIGLFEQLNWLTTRVKRLCCAVEQIQQSGAGSYKVYTALLTQSGGDNQVLLNNSDLTIGVTYFIDNNGGGTADFTNVGAPNNNVGTYFVATGTTPNSWGVGNTAEIFYNTGAPVVKVLDNTIGNVWFTYDSVGNYNLNSNGLFTVNKTIQFLNNILREEGDLNINNFTDGNLIYFQSKNYSFDSVDGYFNNTPIEIRVYN